MPRKAKPEAQRKQALNKRLREQEQHQRRYAQWRLGQKKERDRLLLRTIKAASKAGIYNPKELKLTKYRRHRAQQALREYGDFLDLKRFFFVKAPKKARRTILARAENLEIRHTRTGLFVPKEGHKRAKLKLDRKRKEYYIDRSGRTKRGPTKGVRYRTITPLASVDELDRERDRIRRLAKEFEPLKNSDRVTFKVVENGLEGYSHTTFSNVELLLNYLEHYRKSLAAKINFYRHIELEKTTAVQWFADHPSTDTGRKGRKQRDEIRRATQEKQKVQVRTTRTRKKKIR